MSLGTVWRREKIGEESGKKYRLAAEIRSLESRWDLIESYVGSLQEAEAAASMKPEEISVNEEVFKRP